MSTARTFVDGILTYSEIKRACVPRTESKAVEIESLDESARSIVSWKPCGPDLNGFPQVFRGTAKLTGIQKQITKPPGSAAISHPYSKEPDFVAASGREGGVNGVQGLHFNSTAQTGQLPCRIHEKPIARGSILGTTPAQILKDDAICGSDVHVENPIIK